jgi:hypothetical protein
MTLENIIHELDLKLLTEAKDFSKVEPTNGYASDLLSCVMAGSSKQGIWITLQSHHNIVAVAALLELAAIIITEGAVPDEATIEKANTEGVPLFSTSAKTFEVAGKLWEMGLPSS